MQPACTPDRTTAKPRATFQPTTRRPSARAVRVSLASLLSGHGFGGHLCRPHPFPGARRACVGPRRPASDTSRRAVPDGRTVDPSHTSGDQTRRVQPRRGPRCTGLSAGAYRTLLTVFTRRSTTSSSVPPTCEPPKPERSRRGRPQCRPVGRLGKTPGRRTSRLVPVFPRF